MNSESTNGNPNATEDAQENNELIDQVENGEESAEIESDEAEADEQEELFGMADLESEEEEETEEQEAEEHGLQAEENAEDLPAGEETEIAAAPPARDQEEVLSPDRARYKAITEEAKRKVEEITGEEYDEFNDEHRVILTDQAHVIGNRKRDESRAFDEAEKIIATAGGDKFRDYLADHMQNLSVREYNKLVAAEAAGDFSKTLEVTRTAADKFKNTNIGAAAKRKAAELNKVAPRFAAENKTAQPPKTIGSGTGAAPARHKSKETFGLEDLGLDAD